MVISPLLPIAAPDPSSKRSDGKPTSLPSVVNAGRRRLQSAEGGSLVRVNGRGEERRCSLTVSVGAGAGGWGWCWCWLLCFACDAAVGTKCGRGDAVNAIVHVGGTGESRCLSPCPYTHSGSSRCPLCRRVAEDEGDSGWDLSEEDTATLLMNVVVSGVAPHAVITRRGHRLHHPPPPVTDAASGPAPCDRAEAVAAVPVASGR